jgi:hypothetical protein
VNIARDIASMFRTVAAKKDSASVPSVSLTDPAAPHSSDDIGPLVQSTNASTSKNNVILEDAGAQEQPPPMPPLPPSVYNLHRLPQDPVDRIPIISYPVNDQDVL